MSQGAASALGHLLAAASSLHPSVHRSLLVRASARHEVAQPTRELIAEPALDVDRLEPSQTAVSGCYHHHRSPRRSPTGVTLMSTGAITLVARRDAAGLAFSSLLYEPGTTLESHVHPLAYLSYVGAGSYMERVGRTTRHCRPSTLQLHAAGERHSNVFHDRPVRLLRVEATDSRLLELSGIGRALDGRDAEPSGHLCRRMLRELQGPDDVTPLVLHGLVLELVAGLTRASACSRSREPSWLDRVDEFLRAGFDTPISLSAIAAHAGVHPVHLARTYRRHRHRTVGDRIRELRIEHACRLLATTRDSIADIAHRSGFVDQSHLARLMRQRLGVTPTQYRAERAPR